MAAPDIEAQGSAEAPAVPDPIEITEHSLLVVEGRDEVSFFEALSENLGIQGLQIIELGGKDQMRPRLKALSLSPRFSEVQSVGVIRDADTSPDAALMSVCDALRNANLPTPQRCLAPVPGRPRVTVMILPAEGSEGMLEDLCLRSVAEDEATTCVEQYFECLKQCCREQPSNLAKAKVQAFLASRRISGLPLGLAAKKGYWPWESAAFQDVKDFLQQICS